jgi:hypothetical protein
MAENETIKENEFDKSQKKKLNKAPGVKKAKLLPKQGIQLFKLIKMLNHIFFFFLFKKILILIIVNKIV